MAVPRNALPTTNSGSVPPAGSNIARVATVNIPRGSDVIGFLIDIARRGNFCFTIINAIGEIASATLSILPGFPPVMMIDETSSIISLSGSYIHNNQYTLHNGAAPPVPSSFKIILHTSEGDFGGGVDVGRVFAGNGGVRVVLSTYRNADVYQLG